MGRITRRHDWILVVLVLVEGLVEGRKHIRGQDCFDLVLRRGNDQLALRLYLNALLGLGQELL
jgi:hypothetical protein